MNIWKGQINDFYGLCAFWRAGKWFIWLMKIYGKVGILKGKWVIRIADKSEQFVGR